MGTFVDIFFGVRLLSELIRVLALGLGAPDVAAWLLAALVFVAGAVFTGAVEWLVGEYGMKPLITRLRRAVSHEHSPEGPDDKSEESGRLQREVGRLEGENSVLRRDLARECRKNERLEVELREARRPWWRKISKR